MKEYQDMVQIADSIIKEARSYVDGAGDYEVIVLDDYYAELEKLNLTKEDKELYRIRLDFIFYSEQY